MTRYKTREDLGATQALLADMPRMSYSRFLNNLFNISVTVVDLECME